MKRNIIRIFWNTAVIVSSAILMFSCETYDEVPPKSVGNDYKLAPLATSTPTNEEMDEWRAVREEHENATNN